MTRKFFEFDVNGIKAQTGLKSVFHLDSTNSTNDVALQRAKSGSNEFPFLVVTPDQRHGRGQRANQWLSSAGSLTFSYACVFETKAAPFWLPAHTAIAICQAIESLTALAPKIKWPNDILVDDRKLGGVLIESAHSERDLVCVIGIGVNVNNETSEYGLKQDLGLPPVSICELEKRISLNELLVGIVNRLKAGKPSDAWRDDYNSRLFCMGKPTDVRLSNGKVVKGKCKGISRQGELLIQMDDQQVAVLSGRIISN